MSERLDRWVSARLRQEIEDRYYAKVNKQARFEHLINDPSFLAAPDKHVGLFSDHGVLHVRDVANQILDVLDNCHGVLIPQRDPQRFGFMQGYGVLVAYFHDIGMVDFSDFGRAMHPEFAAQALFDPALDDLVELIWADNSGGLAWHLSTLNDRGLLEQDPIIVLREMLSLQVCHSKRKVPVARLNDPVRLRDLMLATIGTNLDYHYAEQQRQTAERELREGSGEESDKWKEVKAAAEVRMAAYDEAERRNPHVDRFYDCLPRDAYRWLISEQPALQALVEDVVDTLRALRSADALRKRGTVLVTSGNYQIFVDHRRGSAIYALRSGEDQMFLLEMKDPISAGEANIASSELDPGGDLRISFYRGAFSASGGQDFAVYCAAIIIHDIQSDVIESFCRPTAVPELKPASEMTILVEETDDNLSFTELVKMKLEDLAPQVSKRVRLVPSLKRAHPLERARYLAADPVAWDIQARRNLLAYMSQSGHPVERIDLERAFETVRVATLNAGDVLLEGAATSTFVYVPLDQGLKIMPVAGYQSINTPPFVLLGLTGVVRDAERNATIVAERNVRVLIIPKSPYLRYWHHTLSLEAFQQSITETRFAGPNESRLIPQLKKRFLLQSVPLFNSLDEAAFTELLAQVQEAQVAAGETLFEKGAVGRSLYVVAEGSLTIHDGDLTLRQLGPGDVFGELAVITPEPRMASVTAREDSLLLRLKQQALDNLIETNPSLASGIIKMLAKYVRDLAAELTKLNG